MSDATKPKSDYEVVAKYFTLVNHDDGVVWLLLRADPVNNLGAGNIRVEGEMAKDLVRRFKLMETQS